LIFSSLAGKTPRSWVFPAQDPPPLPPDPTPTTTRPHPHCPIFPHMFLHFYFAMLVCQGMRHRFLKNILFGFASNRAEVLAGSVFKDPAAFNDGFRYGMTERDTNYILSLALSVSNAALNKWTYTLPASPNTGWILDVKRLMTGKAATVPTTSDHIAASDAWIVPTSTGSAHTRNRLRFACVTFGRVSGLALGVIPPSTTGTAGPSSPLPEDVRFSTNIPHPTASLAMLPAHRTYFWRGASA
jgi:hypothetical protein